MIKTDLKSNILEVRARFTIPEIHKLLQIIHKNTKIITNKTRSEKFANEQKEFQKLNTEFNLSR
jgi:hypothetical protein